MVIEGSLTLQLVIVPLQSVDTSNGSPIFYVDHEESSWGTYPFPVLQSKGEVRLLYLLAQILGVQCLSHLFNLGRAKYQNPFSDSNQYWVCGSEVCLAVRESLFSGCGYSHKQFRLWSCSSLFVVGAMICNNISMFSPYKHSNVWIQKRFLLQALMRCGGCTHEIFASCRSWEHWPVSTKQKKERLKTV